MNILASITNGLGHVFLPRRSNNYRAHLLQTTGIFAAFLMLLFSSQMIRILSLPSVGVLGYAANISPQTVALLTNEKRAEAGAPPLTFSSELAEAARLKGLDMLEVGYWAHVSPDGREPWDFFRMVNYSYRYAGENLARDFSDPASAVNAWMASPTHKENMLASRYEEIGIAVVEGMLNGEDTTIIVQLFGTRAEAPASIPVAAAAENRLAAITEEVEQSPTPAPESTPTPEPKVEIVPIALAGLNEPPPQAPTIAVGRFDAIRAVGIGLVAVMLFALATDAFYVARMGISRAGGRPIAHISFMAMVMVVILLIRAGQII